MGAGNFDMTAFKIQAREAKARVNAGFTASSMCDEFNPAKVSTRYSKKGPFNEFRDVITVLIGLDVTGSMDKIPKSLLEGRLGSLMVDLKKIFNKPNENLQISFAGIGDGKTDAAPLQVTHFESDNRFAQQLQKIWLEGHGGGNGAESYNLLWWYAANKTHLNYVTQDERKGILITIGDDNVHPTLTAKEIQDCLDPQYRGEDISNEVLLSAVREQYDVYHIVITDGDAYRYDHLKKANKSAEQKKEEAERWRNLLGRNNVIDCKSDNVADAIVDIITQHRPTQKLAITDLTAEEWSKQNKENLDDKQWVEVLGYTLCPLTRQFMEHPVTIGDSKRAYEKRAIESYIREHQADPQTHEKLTLSKLVFKPNLNIAQLCSNYRSFFEFLPESKREYLVNLTLGEIKDEVKIEKNEPDETSRNPHRLFSQIESGQALEKLEQMKLILECPITHEIMRDPVILVCTGQSYEREEIEKWLEDHDTDPLTREKLTDKKLIPNYALRSLCEEARSGLRLKT